jgi:hypothetical protein
MALAGLLLLGHRYGIIKLPLPPFPDKYQISKKA